MEINGLIGALLLQHNCVVIPSFGGFVAKTASAVVDFDKGKMTPPKKLLTFNSQLVNNDGLLATFCANKNNVSYNEALQSLNQFVSESKEALNKGARVHFQNVGYLYYNEAGAIAFEQDRFFNLLLGAYGMSDIHFIPEQKESIIPNEKPVVPEEEKETPIRPIVANVLQKEEEESLEEKSVAKKPVYKRLAKYAAAAALIPVLFYSFWIPMNTDVLESKVLYKNDFNPFYETPTAVYSKSKQKKIGLEKVNTKNEFKSLVENLPESVPFFSYPLTEDQYIIVKNPAAKDKTNVVKTVSVNHNNLSKKAAVNYHLIAGCFSNIDNATGFVETMKSNGYNATIIDYNNGLHRVSILKENSRAAVKKLHKSLKEQGTSTWILKK